LSTISFLSNPPVSAGAVSDLREAVGWARLETEQADELTGYWATIGGFDEHETLIAWCELLSDGKYHGVLLDVLVHPHWQKQGIGRALVKQAVAYLHAHNIRIIHVDFLPERSAFYERCGFRIGLGGIYEG
jgi:GNAT superfamily N-acetyltransferase